MQTNALLLRPHHLLCIPHFTGHGYDAAFTENMNAVTGRLAAQPQTPVVLTPHCDVLCACCPHSTGGVCASQEKVAAMDSAVLTVCALTTGQPLPWDTLAGTVRSRILHTDAFAQICADCEWYALCRKIHLERNFSDD